MGDSRFCLVEIVMDRNKNVLDAVLHVTLFGLKYDSKGELATNYRTTRSYALPKNTILFSHAAFWMLNTGYSSVFVELIIFDNSMLSTCMSLCTGYRICSR